MALPGAGLAAGAWQDYPRAMSYRFTRTFVAQPQHIDELGHVNNTVWVQWIQDMATAHWDAVARPEDRAAFFWVVVRHEIDYLRALGPGDLNRIEPQPQILNPVADIDRRALDRERPRLALREVEHIVDLPPEHRNRIHDRVDIDLLLLAELARIARLHHFGEATDRRALEVAQAQQTSARAQTRANEDTGTDLVQAQAQLAQTDAEAARLKLATLRYNNGVANQLDLLDAQRSLFASQQAFIAAQLARQQAHIALYKALGGGWAAEASVPAASAPASASQPTSNQP